MERVTAWKTKNGEVETDPVRAKARELNLESPKNTPLGNETVVSFSVALWLMNNRRMVRRHFDELDQALARDEHFDVLDPE